MIDIAPTKKAYFCEDDSGNTGDVWIYFPRRDMNFGERDASAFRYNVVSPKIRNHDAPASSNRPLAKRLIDGRVQYNSRSMITKPVGKKCERDPPTNSIPNKRV